MLATTSGVIHKNQVLLDKNHVNDFLENQKEIYRNFLNFKNVVYDKDTIISDVASNYINVVPCGEDIKSLKNILLSEYYDCERIYPYLGDYFLYNLLAGKKAICSKKFLFHMKLEEKFKNSLKYKVSVNFADWFLNNINLNRSVNIEEYPGDELSVECLEDFVFNIDYDYSFFETRQKKEIKNYRYVIINGMIESVGEIHHLLQKSNETKEAYVIFCFGMSDEVKTTIIKNNQMGRIKVYPVCLNSSDESSLNILNDIAAIHGGSVLSSDLGITISQEVRKELPIGKKISFLKNNIVIFPCISEIEIKSHRMFLKKRLENAQCQPDVRTDVLEKRIKNFTGKKVNIYLPSRFRKNKKLMRELDYFLRFISNTNKSMSIVNLNSEKFYIPVPYINIAKNKIKSLNNKFANIKAIVF
jgi:hypothetical protein